MIQGLLVTVHTLFRNTIKLKDWVQNPMNGNNPVSPFKRQYLSTGVSLAVIICYRIGEALYNFLTSYVLDGFAYLFNALLGITSDLWHSNPSYSRWASKGALSALTTIGISTVVAGKMIGSGLLVLIR